MNFKIKIILIAMFGYVGYLTSCTNDDQVIEQEEVTNSETDLVSIKVSTPPTIDGTIDALWETSTKLEFEAVVPDATGDLFRSFVGNIIPSITLRSVYDTENIYFLAEWVDPTESLARQPWYFDPITKKWAQESGAPVFSATGSVTRKAFGEDKLGMLWNIDNTVSGWSTATCYKSCHTGLGSTDGDGRHFTNYPTERIDMWHWKSTRSNVNGQFDDQLQNNTYPNGRTNDDKVSGGDVNNTQTLNQPGIGNVSVPKYVIPGRTNYYWILQTEVDAGTAKLVTAINADGVLTLSDATTIDPNVGTDYQRVGAGVGSKVIPGITTSPFVGSRGDITCVGKHTGAGWVLEYKRALKTTEEENKNQDVDFSSLEDQNFGVAIFDNIGPAHAIKPNLVLKFKE